MKRMNLNTDAKWESIVGYSRAVRVGSQIYISGTTSVNENGQIIGEGDPYVQTVQILKKIEKVLSRAGATLNDVVRTRIYVTNIDNWNIIGRAHVKFFENIRPAATMVEVKRLIQPELLVEIEAEAVVG